MELGEHLPSVAFRNVTGEQVDPNAVVRNQTLLFLFYASDCPYSDAYKGRLRELFEKYMDDELRFFLVNVNPPSVIENDPVKQELSNVGANGRNFLMDDDREAAGKFSADVTPEAFLFDRNKELVYKGAIDDDWKNPAAVTRVFLEDALENALDNLDVDFPEIQPEGTPIEKLANRGTG